MTFKGIQLDDLKETLMTLARSRYVCAVSIFLVWITFFDSDNLFVKYGKSKEIERLEAERDRLTSAIKEDKRRMSELRNNRESLEKFAREEYFMKKDDEVVFIIQD